MNDRFSEIRKRICALAQQEQNILSVIEIGSQTRKKNTADAYSDLDVILVCKCYDAYLHSDEKLSEIGDIKISFIEDTFGGGKERRILFDGSLDVDFILLNKKQILALLNSGFLNGIFARGYAVLYDSIGLRDQISIPAHSDVIKREMTGSDFQNMVSDFWFHTVWAAKKIRRGEYWVALMCVNAYLKSYLLRILELYYGGGDAGSDVWHDGRFLETWADAQTLNELQGCFAAYDESSMQTALMHTADLFSRLARACAKRDGLPYPETAEEYAKSVYGALLLRR